MLLFPSPLEECGSLAISAFALPLVKGKGWEGVAGLEREALQY